MKNLTIAAIAGLGVSAAASAGLSTDFDISGQVADGAAPNVLEFVQQTTEPLESISFNLDYTAGDAFGNASWASELNIRIEHESGFVLTADGSDANFADLGPDNVIFGWGDESGTFTFSDTIAISDGPTDTSGVWTITLTDEFDDTGGDGQFNAGSVISVNKVPAPGAVALFGVAGLLGARRRR